MHEAFQTFKWGGKETFSCKTLRFHFFQLFSLLDQGTEKQDNTKKQGSYSLVQELNYFLFMRTFVCEDGSVLSSIAFSKSK